MFVFRKCILFSLAIVCCLALVFEADAGPFGIFGRRRAANSCDSGQCQPAASRGFSGGCQSCANGTCGVAGCQAQNCPDGVCAVPGSQFGAIGAEPAFRNDLAKKSFAGALQSHLKAKGSLSLGERHVLKILNSPDSAARDRKLARMEGHVRVELGYAPGATIDWSTIDWAALFQTIMQILLMLLPLL